MIFGLGVTILVGIPLFVGGERGVPGRYRCLDRSVVYAGIKSFAWLAAIITDPGAALIKRGMTIMARAAEVGGSFEGGRNKRVRYASDFSFSFQTLTHHHFEDVRYLLLNQQECTCSTRAASAAVIAAKRARQHCLFASHFSRERSTSSALR